MTFNKKFLPGQTGYRQSSVSRLELPVRLQLFLLALAVMMVSFGVLLAYLMH